MTRLTEPLQGYADKIRKAFKDICEMQGDASPIDVTNLLRERGQLSSVDTVIDIADIMRELREEGLL
jgi:hypothetical protein